MHASAIRPLQGLAAILGSGRSFLEDVDKKRKEGDMRRTCCLCRVVVIGKSNLDEGKVLICESSYRDVWVCQPCVREHPGLTYRQARNIEERQGYRQIRQAKGTVRE